MSRTVPGRSYIETLITVGDFDTARRAAWGYEGAEREELLKLVAKAEVAALIADGKLLEAEAVIAQLPGGPIRMAADALLTQTHIKNTLAAASLTL